MSRKSSTRAVANLLQWARAQEITTDDKQREQLEIYLDNVLLWNRRVALVSQSDPTSIAEKHFADALVAARHCQGASRVVDIGSGAGFPGMIIAIQSPTTRVTLVESRQRKASFLLDTARTANLENVEVVAERVENLASRPLHAGSYEIAIARALGSVEALLEYSRALLSDAGRAIAMKGPSYRSEIEEPSIGRLGFRPPTIHPYSLPDLAQRVLLSFALAPVPS
jgi:16S rRNA (guanine527-N7)-methyltransferase